MSFARSEMTARKNAQPKQKRLRIQLLAGDYLNKPRNIFCRPERPEKGVKLCIKESRLDINSRDQRGGYFTLTSIPGKYLSASLAIVPSARTLSIAASSCFLVASSPLRSPKPIPLPRMVSSDTGLPDAILLIPWYYVNTMTHQEGFLA